MCACHESRRGAAKSCRRRGLREADFAPHLPLTRPSRRPSIRPATRRKIPPTGSGLNGWWQIEGIVKTASRRTPLLRLDALLDRSKLSDPGYVELLRLVDRLPRRDVQAFLPSLLLPVRCGRQRRGDGYRACAAEGTCTGVADENSGQGHAFPLTHDCQLASCCLSCGRP